MIGHLDRTIFNIEGLVELATTGCYLEFDLFGKEDTHYQFAPIDMPNDGQLVDSIAEIAPAEATRRRMLVDNPAELFGF